MARHITAGELAARVHAAAFFLQEQLCVKPGNYVALLAHNSSWYVSVSLGTMSIGATALHLNWRQPVSTHLDLIAGLQPRVIFASEPFLAHAPELCAAAGVQCNCVAAADLEALVVVSEGAGAASLGALLHRNEWSSSTAAAVFFTGGTTGAPKAVPHTHEALLWLCEALFQVDPAAYAEPRLGGTICFTPYFHVMGFVVNLAT